VSTLVLNDLAQIFTKHKVHGLFGIGLLHSHCTMNLDKVMFSTKLKNSVSGCWTKAKDKADVDVTQVRGQMFKLARDHRLVAYKLEEGQVPGHSFDNETFIREFCDYLMTNRLTEVLGLQVLSGATMCGVEFDFGEAGTVTINSADANHGPFSHTTGWTISMDDAGITSCKGSTQHAATTRGPHKVFVDSKLALDEQDLVQILHEYDVLVRHTPLTYDTSG
jgi:hypothetical protein